MSNRQLTLAQKQAYQGAKSFYQCFLPFVILSVTSLHIYFWDFGYVLLDLFTIGSYLIALKYYSLCNTLDTSLKRLNMKKLETSDSEMSEEVAINKKQIVEEAEKTRIRDRPQKKFCQKCNFTIPYRSKHCRKCQTCIQKYDHHCFWIGNCVGYNNHRQFYLFLLFQTLNNIFNFISVRNLHEIVDKTRIGYNFWVQTGCYCLDSMSFGFILFTSYLLLYHTILMVSGMTTWEHMSRSRISFLKYLPSGVNPFNKGCSQNIKQFWIHQDQLIQYDIPTYSQAGSLQSSCPILQNRYYSCC